MEAALEYLGKGGIAGKTVAIMGCGNVATSLMGKLFEKGVGRVIVADMNKVSWCLLPFNIEKEAIAAAKKRFAGKPIELRHVAPGDMSILYEEADVISPCAVGGVINCRTIPNIRAKIICGPANNQLEDDQHDDKLLRKRGIRLFNYNCLINKAGSVLILL